MQSIETFGCQNIQGIKGEGVMPETLFLQSRKSVLRPRIKIKIITSKSRVTGAYSLGFFIY
jgi:hypothetical protein